MPVAPGSCAKSGPTRPAMHSVCCLALVALPVLAADDAGRGRTSSRRVGVRRHDAAGLRVIVGVSRGASGRPPRRLLKRLDHAAIYLFMAGTFTPFALGHALGAPLLALVVGRWPPPGVALKLASCLPATARCRPRLYLAFGWLVIAAAQPLLALARARWPAVVAGRWHRLLRGRAVLQRSISALRFGHPVWHVFVLVGSGCHFMAVLKHAVWRRPRVIAAQTISGTSCRIGAHTVGSTWLGVGTRVRYGPEACRRYRSRSLNTPSDGARQPSSFDLALEVRRHRAHREAAPRIAARSPVPPSPDRPRRKCRGAGTTIVKRWADRRPADGIGRHQMTGAVISHRRGSRSARSTSECAHGRRSWNHHGWGQADAWKRPGPQAALPPTRGRPTPNARAPVRIALLRDAFHFHRRHRVERTELPVRRCSSGRSPRGRVARRARVVDARTITSRPLAGLRTRA